MHDTNEVVQPWWENISYEGFIKLSNAAFKPALFHRLTGNEFKLLTYLTFLRWRFAEHHGRLRLGLEYLVKGTGLSEGTIRRCLKSLAEKQFIRLLRIDRNFGNNYLVYTILLSVSPDQIDRTRGSGQWSSDQIDRGARSKRSDGTRPAGTASDQFDQQDQIQTYQSDGAQRHSPIAIEGGVADPGKKVSCGQDHTPGREGVALTGDPLAVARAARAEVEAKCDALDAAARADLEYREKFRRLLIDQKKWKLSRRELEEKLDALAKEYGKETHFKRGPAQNRRKHPVGKRRSEQVSRQEPIFQSGGKR